MHPLQMEAVPGNSVSGSVTSHRSEVGTAVDLYSPLRVYNRTMNGGWPHSAQNTTNNDDAAAWSVSRRHQQAASAARDARHTRQNGSITFRTQKKKKKKRRRKVNIERDAGSQKHDWIANKRTSSWVSLQAFISPGLSSTCEIVQSFRTTSISPLLFAFFFYYFNRVPKFKVLAPEFSRFRSLTVCITHIHTSCCVSVCVGGWCYVTIALWMAPGGKQHRYQNFVKKKYLINNSKYSFINSLLTSNFLILFF